MTPSDDLYPPRRPLFFPVVIATVFLTIIGLTAGFVLGERRNNAAGDDPVATTSPVTEPGPTRTGRRCPPQTSETAARLGLPDDLRQVMKIVTANGTTVWICEDPVGSFYYQGKTGGVDAALEQDVNGLFLSQVVRESATRFVGTDHRGNVFTVSSSRLEITFKDGRPKQASPVVSWE